MGCSSESQELSFKVALKVQVYRVASIKDIQRIIIFPTGFTLVVQLLKVHQVPRQNLVRLVRRVRGESDQHLIKIWRLTLFKTWKFSPFLGVMLCQMGLEGLLIELKADDDVFFIADVGLSSVSPFVSVVQHVRHLGRVMVHDEGSEAVRDIAGLHPHTSRGSGLRLHQLFFLLLMRCGVVLLLGFPITTFAYCWLDAELECSSLAPPFLWGCEWGALCINGLPEHVEHAAFCLMDLICGELTDVVKHWVASA